MLQLRRKAAPPIACHTHSDRVVFVWNRKVSENASGETTAMR